MQNTANRWMSGLFLLAMFAIVAFAGTHSAAQASSVLVTNTTSQPVPTTVQGTPNVRSLQGGTWNVYLLGSPTLRINNAPSAPIPNRDVDNPDRYAFQLSDVEYTQDGSPGSSYLTYTVPAGKRLVVTYVSCFSDHTPGGTPSNVCQMSLKNTNAAPTILLTLPIDYVDSTHQLLSRQVRCIADAGSTLQVQAQRSDWTGLINNYILISGNLINYP
jgi:hypothetical protein